MTKGIFLPKFSPDKSYVLILDKSVSKGKQVIVGQRIGKLLITNDAIPSHQDEQVLYSDKKGWVELIHFESDAGPLHSIEDSGAKLLDLVDENPCPHDVVINRLCCGCGEIIKSAHSVSVGGIQISQKYAESISQPKIQEIFRQRKLMLILDLDHTLIHAEQYAPPPDFLRDTEIHAFEEELKLLPPDSCAGTGCLQPEKQVIIDGRNLKRHFEVLNENDEVVDYCHYVTNAETDDKTRLRIALLESAIFYMETGSFISHFKLRPGVIRFLREMSSKFELYIYTAGIDMHAATALQLLDPDRRFFPSGHIFSRESVSKNGVKSLSRVLPTDHHAMIVVDDTPAAWDNDVGLFVVSDKFNRFALSATPMYGSLGGIILYCRNIHSRWISKFARFVGLSGSMRPLL